MAVSESPFMIVQGPETIARMLASHTEENIVMDRHKIGSVEASLCRLCKSKQPAALKLSSAVTSSLVL
jgi:hypothetical protein